MSDKTKKFTNTLRDLADLLDGANNKRPAADASAAAGTQPASKKVRFAEPSQQQSSSSYQKLKQANRSLKETVDQLREVTNLPGINEAHRASLVAAIMREAGLDGGDPVPEASSSSQQQQQQQQPPQQQQQPPQQQQQQPPQQQQQQQQQQQPFAELMLRQQQQQQPSQQYDLSDTNARRSYLAQMLGNTGGGGQNGSVAEARQALAQTLMEGMNQRIAAGEDPGLIGIAATSMQQQGQGVGQSDAEFAAQALTGQYGMGGAQPSAN